MHIQYSHRNRGSGRPTVIVFGQLTARRPLEAQYSPGRSRSRAAVAHNNAQDWRDIQRHRRSQGPVANIYCTVRAYLRARERPRHGHCRPVPTTRGGGRLRSDSGSYSRSSLELKLHACARSMRPNAALGGNRRNVSSPRCSREPLRVRGPSHLQLPSVATVGQVPYTAASDAIKLGTSPSRTCSSYFPRKEMVALTTRDGPTLE